MSEKSTNVLEQYDFQLVRSMRGRGAMLCETDKGLMLLKEYGGSVLRLTLEDEILRSLEMSGMRVDAYVKNRDEQLLSIDTDGTKYVLKKWHAGRECDVRNTAEILTAVRTLSELHAALRRAVTGLTEESRHELKRFAAPPLAVTLDRHQHELKKVRGYIRSKQKKSEFELQVLKNFEEFYEQGKESLELLRSSAYEELKTQADGELRLCHGNYNHHNILIEGRAAAVVNFDKLSVDMQLVDLYLFMRKILEKYNWEARLGCQMLEEYQKKLELSCEEKEVLKYLFLYPEKFWKLVNHYYNNNKAWIPKKDLEKLDAVIRQSNAKKVCLEKML